MIIRARAVVTMDGAPIENGAVGIAGNLIEQVGRWRDFRPGANDEVVDLGERTLLPGLINAHCHLDYTMMRGAIPASASFAEWIRSINALKAALTADDYARAIEEGFAEAASFGTTTVANLEAFPELIGRIKYAPLRTWWFAEMIDVRGSLSARDVLNGLEKAAVSTAGGVGLAPHAPFTVSRELYEEAGKLAAQRHIPITTHLAESAEEMEMFRDGSGRLFDFLQGIGRPMDDCGQTTPLGVMAREELLNERWLVAHLNELTAGDFTLLERGARFHIVHCPRSHAYFGHSPFAFAKLRALGFNICLGTDSLASNHDLSLFAEMRQFWKTEPSLGADEILKMATANAADALGQGESLGRLRVGCLADLLAVPFCGPLNQVAAEILAFEERSPWILVDGKAVLPC
ncbi:MAG: amidohydrolase family protein [Chthoniobacterales bacterium]